MRRRERARKKDTKKELEREGGREKERERESERERVTGDYIGYLCCRGIYPDTIHRHGCVAEEHT